MTRLIRPPLLLAVVLMAASSWATTYYIAANGSDSNTGTLTTTPWLHAPGMTGCTANCAAKTPQPGDQFIFRGGDTWHGGVSPISLPWTWSWNGSSNNPIYIGVDNSTASASGSGTTGWYNAAVCGASWCQPIFDGDNPRSVNPVSACAHQISGNSSFVFFANVSWNKFDNFEFRGVCYQFIASVGNQPPYGSDGYLSVAYSQTSQGNNTFSNLYFHGWTHKPFNCSYTTGLVGMCDYPLAIQNASQSTFGGGDLWNRITCDGSDSDPTSYGCFFGEAYEISNSVIRYNAQGIVTNNTHLLHDTLIEHISESSDGIRHSNGFEFNGEWSGSNQVYNILLRNNSAAVTGWVCPNSTDYYYNNIVHHAGSQPWDFDKSCGGSAVFYNNTFADGGTCIGNGGANWPGTFNNNLFINQSICNAPTGGITSSISLTDTQANARGYTSANDYQPTSQTCNGNSSSCPVGTGGNLKNSCTAIGSPLCSDSTNGNTRNAVARPSSGAWDIGAFQFGGATASVNPPGGLSAIVQ